MPSSLVFWSVAAVVLFWAVGAYNRLVRLRSEARTTFANLDAELMRQVELVQASLSAQGEQEDPAPRETDASRAGLQGAASQLHATLAAMRQRPLEPAGIAALHAAQDVLAMAWDRAERDDVHDLAGPRLPESVGPARALLAAQTRAAVDQFNHAVARYNAGIAQFPAVLLAWLFGFKPARELRDALRG